MENGIKCKNLQMESSEREYRSIHDISMDLKRVFDVIREEPFDKDPSKIQSTTQKPPKS